RQAQGSGREGCPQACGERRQAIVNIIHLNSNAEAWRKLHASIFSVGSAGVDIETTHLEPHLGRIRLVQFSVDGETAYILDMIKADVFERCWVSDIVSDVKVVKIAHNAKFEIAWFTRHVLPETGARARMWFCTE